MHSRPRPEGSTFNEITSFGDDPTPALGAALQAAHGTSGLRQRTTGRPGGGRHRLSLLATSGDQPSWSAAGRRPRSRAGSPPRRRPAGRRAARRRPGRPLHAGRLPARLPARLRRARPRRPPRRARAVAALGPRLGAVRASTGRLGLRARPTPGCARPTWAAGRAAARPPGASATRQTQAGLPQRVPRSNAGFDGPPSGYDCVPPGRGAGPRRAAGSGAQGMGAGAQRGTQATPQTPRRRSPEAARNRLAGFQLGNRDATQAGSAPGWTPYAGEETSR